MNYETVVDTIKEMLQERGDAIPALAPETPMLETGLDSLDVAALVARLEDRLGIDPFSSGELTEFPTTLKDFVSLYDTQPADSRTI